MLIIIIKPDGFNACPFGALVKRAEFPGAASGWPVTRTGLAIRNDFSLAGAEFFLDLLSFIEHLVIRLHPLLLRSNLRPSTHPLLNDQI